MIAQSTLNGCALHTAKQVCSLERSACALLGCHTWWRQLCSRLLDRFCAEISRHAVARRSVLIPIWDQAYHNMILRDHPPAQFNPMPWHSQIATVGEVPSEFLEVQPDGYISVNGKVPAILHQYDRHSAVVECISEQYTVPSTFKTFLTGG